MALDVSPDAVRAQAGKAAESADAMRQLTHELHSPAGGTFAVDQVVAQLLPHLQEQAGKLAANLDELSEGMKASADSITEVEARNTAAAAQFPWLGGGA
ncbi:hypothetical protein GCM10028820_05810 [Tessaracoccus terricola]